MTEALTVACPTCHAAPEQRCRTLTTGRTTDVHSARWLELARSRHHPSARRRHLHVVR